MAVEVDHVFVCASIEAPEAERLIEFGLVEGSPNVHPGQGTACRRFFFANLMLELLWVRDPLEAREPLRLWDRWSGRAEATSPFGILLRPSDGRKHAPPFPSWSYQPPLMPDLSIEIASGTGVGEPLWAYIPSARRPDQAAPDRRQPFEHKVGLREVTRITLITPNRSADGVTAEMGRIGLIALEDGPAHALELEFDHAGQGLRWDFRPDLPIVFRW